MLDRRFAQSDFGGGEQNLVQRGADLGSREHGAQAVVRAATAERHVGIVAARNVKIEGVVEDVFVAIGRAKHCDDTGALFDRGIAQHDVAASATDPEDDRRRPAEYFLHGTRADVGIAAIAVGLGGVGDESADAVAQCVARGVTAGQRQDEEEDFQLVGRQSGFSAGLIVDLGGAQGAPDVVDGMLPLLRGQFACVLEADMLAGQAGYAVMADRMYAITSGFVHGFKWATRYVRRERELLGVVADSLAAALIMTESAIALFEAQAQNLTGIQREQLYPDLLAPTIRAWSLRYAPD